MSKQEEMPTKSVSIRFPADLLEGLRKTAKQHNRSLNGEVITAIRDHIKKSQNKER
jgi:hypothetical protein